MHFGVPLLGHSKPREQTWRAALCVKEQSGRKHASPWRHGVGLRVGWPKVQPALSHAKPFRHGFLPLCGENGSDMGRRR